MRCPFLRDEQVKSCRAVPFRKPFARAALKGADERCSSAEHVRCQALPPSREAHPATARCPFLHESLVQFCAAAPLPTYVPWSESPELRCGHDGHRFCELFLAVTGSAGRGPALDAADGSAARVFDVDGIPVPGWLHFTPNHMWLDAGDDGLVHLGLDAFLLRLVGDVDGLTFLAAKGSARPAVVLSVRGTDLTLGFEHPLHIVAANTRLRSSLEILASDPYGAGWLFEARVGEPATVLAGLVHGEPARAWMQSEVRRASQLVHEHAAPGSAIGALASDGGTFARGAVRHLERDAILRLFAELFPAPTATRRPA